MTAAVLTGAAVRFATGVVPHAETMGAVGFLALAANVTCLTLLYRRRSDDLNMRSTWICSRNDIIANVGVLVAAGAVAAVGSNWPDIAVGALIATLFLRDSLSIVRESLAALRRPERVA